MHYLACLLFPLVFALICGFPVCEQDWTLSHPLCVPNPRLCCHTVIVSALVQSILSVHIITAMETLLKGQLFLSCRLYCQDFCLLSFFENSYPSSSPELSDSLLFAFVLRQGLLLGVLALPCLAHSCGPAAPYLSVLFLFWAICLLISWFLLLCLPPLLFVSSFLRRVL